MALAGPFKNLKRIQIVSETIAIYWFGHIIQSIFGYIDGLVLILGQIMPFGSDWLF